MNDSDVTLEKHSLEILWSEITAISHGFICWGLEIDDLQGPLPNQSILWFYDIKNDKFTNTGNVDAEGSWEDQPDMGSGIHVPVARVSFNLI